MAFQTALAALLIASGLIAMGCIVALLSKRRRSRPTLKRSPAKDSALTRLGPPPDGQSHAPEAPDSAIANQQTQTESAVDASTSVANTQFQTASHSSNEPAADATPEIPRNGGVPTQAAATEVLVETDVSQGLLDGDPTPDDLGAIESSADEIAPTGDSDPDEELGEEPSSIVPSENGGDQPKVDVPGFPEGDSNTCGDEPGEAAQEALPSGIIPGAAVDAAPVVPKDDVAIRVARPLRKYRPTTRNPEPHPPPTPRKRQDEGRTSQDKALTIDVRLVFERGGFCRISLLPRKTKELPAELALSGSFAPSAIFEMQEDWYQDVYSDGLSELLLRGIEWWATLPDGPTVRWSLAGRSFYVLKGDQSISGFVNVTRLSIGEDHIVICRDDSLQEVLDAVRASGGSEPRILTEDKGLPHGWCALIGVNPSRPVPTDPASANLEPLRPLPDISINLVGGIRLERQIWLEGYPPKVFLTGPPESIGKVFIDGVEAERAPSGAYQSSNWDSRGTHKVWCASESQSYTIRAGEERWSAWNAYRWSLGEPSNDEEQTIPSICGALVLSPASTSWKNAVFVPSDKNILIGSVPGQIHFCISRPDLHSAVAIGFPEFEPVWAIPRIPSQNRKDKLQVMLLKRLESPRGLPKAVNSFGRQSAKRNREIMAWCAAIRAAGAMGLRPDATDPAAAALWLRYRKQAKKIWKCVQ